jgi:asparagine synthase (glutamine-hydrolysing)
MSVQFGIWNTDGAPIDYEYLLRAGSILREYAPDGQSSWCKDSLAILYYPFHTTTDALKEAQPLELASGQVLTFDGSLHNREDLVNELRLEAGTGPTDVEVVAAAYLERGLACLPKFIGDWALSVWNSKTHSLVLAKDPIGPRHLYYSWNPHQILWSTLLDPLLLLPSCGLSLNEEYMAGWLSQFPAAHLTPYSGISAVRPATFVHFDAGGPAKVTTYWNFDGHKEIRYAQDSQYEEHFRECFRRAVKRRVFSVGPALAELSGGMDSSSIVCVADKILSDEGRPVSDLLTISYYDESEPNWNERPYFTKVEELRGLKGYHVDVGPETKSYSNPATLSFAATPLIYARDRSHVNRLFAGHVISRRTRVLLSGIGGDEVTGGVPSPLPLLMNLIATRQLHSLARQLKLWALVKRQPWIHLLLDALRGFIPRALNRSRSEIVPSWLAKEFVRRQRRALAGYSARFSFFRQLPTFQDHLSTIEGLRRQLASMPLGSNPLVERRYPYLDRNLLEFLFAIPPEQLLQPGYRRSLMRRALKGLVPTEILERRRKAYMTQTPLARAIAEAAETFPANTDSLSARFGVVNQIALRETLDRARRGEEVAVVSLLRTNALEAWLENITAVLGSRLETNRDTGHAHRPFARIAAMRLSRLTTKFDP